MAGSDFLQTLGLFDGWDPAQLDRVAAVCVERRYAPRKVIFREYRRGDEMCFVKSGALLVQISTSGPDSSAPTGPSVALRTIARIMPGQFVGEQAMVDDAVRSAAVVAAEPTVLVLMARAGIEGLCREDPRLGYCFMRNIAQELSFKLRNTGLLMRGELWSSQGRTAPADAGFGFDALTDPEA